MSQAATTSLQQLTAKLGDALWKEISPPTYIVLWTQACSHDDGLSIHDQLAILQARSASLLRQSRDIGNAATVIQNALSLERDLEEWSRIASDFLASKPWRENMEPTALVPSGADDPGSYGGNDGLIWSHWHACLVMVTMRREAVTKEVQRSWHMSQQSHHQLSMLRRRAIAAICSAAMCHGGTPVSYRQRTHGSIAFELSLVRPLWIAGVCLRVELRNTQDPVNNLADHSDSFRQTHDIGILSQQLDWVLGRLRHTAFSLGDRHAAQAYACLGCETLQLGGTELHGFSP